MKYLKSNMGSFVMCLCELLVGILLFINPVGFTSGIIRTIGVVLFIIGIINVLAYFGEDPLEAAMDQKLAKGLLAASVGLFCMFRTKWILATFPILTILYGVVIFITGIVKVQHAVDLMRLKSRYWYLVAIGAALAILFALVIVLEPFRSTAFLWTFVAVSLIVQAALDFAALILKDNTDGE